MRSGARPWLTPAIAGVTALAWLIAELSGRATDFDLQLGFIPLRLQLGGPFVVPFALTPLTATLAHGGLLHLAFNMVLFVYCGRQVEAVLGWKPFALLYLVGAYAAALAHFAFNALSPVPMIGASGAISAVLALYALLYGRDEVKAWGPVPGHWMRVLWLAVAWIGLQALMALATRGGGLTVATAAHVGGFVAGLALARPLLRARYRA